MILVARTQRQKSKRKGKPLEERMKKKYRKSNEIIIPTMNRLRLIVDSGLDSGLLLPFQLK